MAGRKSPRKASNAALVASALLIVAACLYFLMHSTSSGTNAIYSYQNESQRASQNGYSLGSSAFSCGYASQCVKVLIAQCDNNNPSQFICVNSAHIGEISDMTKNGGPVACPQYLLAGVISCTCAANYCTESYNFPK